jgi:hypothetical protein
MKLIESQIINSGILDKSSMCFARCYYYFRVDRHTETDQISNNVGLVLANILHNKPITKG